MNNKEVIVILGGGLVKEKDGRWRTTNFNEGDNFGASGDRLRVVAGNYLYEENPQLIIASGGKGQFKDILDAPTVAQVLKMELINLGVSSKDIVLEDNSNNTWQQLQELKKIINKMKLEKVSVVSNEHHLPRVQTMIGKDKELNRIFNNHQIKLISAEKVAIKYKSEKWKKIIKSAYDSREMKKRIALEKKGVRKIKDGKYKLR